MISIIESIKDRRLFRKFLDPFDKGLRSWKNWQICLQILYGLPVKSTEYVEQLVKECTGRELSSFKADGKGFLEALLLCGRRSGKSRIVSLVGSYEASLSGKESSLAPGEVGIVAVISPTKRQGQIIRRYTRGAFEVPLLENEIIREGRDGFELSNKINIEILIGDYRSVRGHTLCCCIVDEICFFGLEAESRIRSDTELIRAVRPGLASMPNSRLIALGSPYAKKGWAYETWKKHFGNNDSNILVWKAPSRTMNYTLSEEIIQNAMTEDKAAALSEYYAEWRSDISQWLSREMIEACVVKGRRELALRNSIRYKAFVDASGGRNDSAVLSIGHIQSEKAIIDFITEFRAPHNPQACIDEMCNILRRWGISRVTGDNYAGEFVSSAFVSNSVGYSKCEKSASELYLEMLGQLCSFNVELLDNETLINQLSSLERRTRSGGKDKVTHPDGGHDDVANSVAGLVYVLKEIKVGTVGAFLRAG